MTAPDRLASRAAVVVDFELAQIVAKQDDVEGVLDFLDADCERIRTPGGDDRWMRRDAARRSALASAGLTDLRQLRQRSRAEVSRCFRTPWIARWRPAGRSGTCRSSPQLRPGR